MSTKIQFRPSFVHTKNVRDFDVLMAGLQLGMEGESEGRLGCVWGRAGRGKTRTVQRFAAKNGCPYIETAIVWSELDFYQAICRHLGISRPPHRRGLCHELAKEALLASGKPLFIDELERLGKRYIEICRDLTKQAKCVLVLVGEEELPHLMQQNRRVWSLTFRAMEFVPVSARDIINYVAETTGLALTDKALDILHKSSGGDLRLVKRDTINLVAAVNALGRSGEVTAETAQIACKEGMTGGI